MASIIDKMNYWEYKKYLNKKGIEFEEKSHYENGCHMVLINTIYYEPKYKDRRFFSHQGIQSTQ